MKKILIAISLLALPVFAQLNTLSTTTTSSAVLATDNFVNVASATGITVQSLSAGTNGSLLYVISPGSKGEIMYATAISGTKITVRRKNGPKAHVSGAVIMHGDVSLFPYSTDPSGGCATATTFVTPYVNLTNGYQWLCSAVTLSWVPGFGNPSRPPGITTAVASAAGAVLPTGPLFHITGTAAITGFTVPLGIVSGDGFCAPTACSPGPRLETSRFLAPPRPQAARSALPGTRSR